MTTKDSLPTPVDVNAKRGEGVVDIRWSDGHQSSYPFDYLRGHCPCAGCQGHGGAHTFHPAEGLAATVMSMDLVGAYAISFGFGDGHDTGLYTYEHLLKICPCETHGGPGYRPENLIGL